MHKRRTSLGALSLLTVAAVLLSACGADPTATTVAPTATTAASAQPTATTAISAQPTSTAGTASSTGEVKVGFAFVTSGDNAVYGTSQKAAAQLAIDEINAAGSGPKLTGVFEDTAAKPDQAFTVFQKFIDADKVPPSSAPPSATKPKPLTQKPRRTPCQSSPSPTPLRA